MSRSIHETWRQWKRERRFDYADEQKTRARSREIATAMVTKSRVKRQMREGRRQEQPYLPTLPETVPILVRDEGPYVHYPASEADIRTVLARLPGGSIDGLTSITLCLGAGEQRADAHLYAPDPLTGRPGSEDLPGVFSGPYFGVYWTGLSTIRLFGYVYDADSLSERRIWELWLRLKMLSTLVHEVGHHVDSMQRVARGRWRMDTKWRNEMYAEAREQEWMLSAVVPYLEEAYLDDVRALRSLVKRYGGIDLPLADLAGEARTTERNDCFNDYGIWNLSSAVGCLISDIHEDRPVQETRTQFARELHYIDRYDEALGILSRILRDNPDSLDAIRLKADIFVHQKRYTEATAILEPMVRDTHGDAESLGLLCDAYEGLERWSRLLRAASRMIAHGDTSTTVFHARRQRTRALMHLGRYDEAEAEIAALARNARSYQQRHIQSLRDEMEILRTPAGTMGA